MDLRLKLDDTDFQTLADSARAMIPALAPEWTDHNIHDPGIMLTELMAWVAEAQIYSLSRIRRDERLAYARLLDIEPKGPRPARGIVWPLENDEPGYSGPNIVGQSIPRGTPIQTDVPDLPPFRVAADQHLSPAILQRVVTYSADGSMADNTRINRRNGATYLPFGSSPGPDDRLVLSFDGYAIAPGGSGAFALGFEMNDPNAAETAEIIPSVEIAIRDATGERPLRLSRDSTAGLTRSGVLLIDISANEQVRAARAEKAWFDLILRPHRGGFLRLPRMRRIVANAIEIEQQESVVEDIADFGQGRPGQTYRLGRVGRTTETKLSVTIGTEQWCCTDHLSRSNPDDPKFEFNQAIGELLFGNGINGRLPPAGAPLHVTYDVCGGTLGNAPANMRWSLRGVSGTFGSNSRPCWGGADAMQFKDLQAEARRKLAERITYVTPGDLEEAARALPLLHVVRAHELPPQRFDLPGTRTLLVIAAAQAGLDPGSAPENPLWLAAVRARLSPHLLLGQHLFVVAPRRVRLGIGVKLRVSSSADPAKVKEQAQTLLGSKFIDPGSGDVIWKLGRDVTPLMVKGWLRKIDGVRAVADVTLSRDGAVQLDRVTLGTTELPVLRTDDARILAERLPVGATS